MSEDVEIIDVDETNVAQRGFFCFRSKRKSPGYQQKLGWLQQRLAEGMRLKILYAGGRAAGFIEYAPGELAWRPVRAADYMVVHCLYRIRQHRGKGYGARLLDACIEDARRTHKRGVAVVVGERTWLSDRTIFDQAGFESVDHAPPAFELLAMRFDDAPPPTFPTDWGERLRRFGPGLTVVYAPQCPYNAGAVETVLEVSREAGIEARVVELESSRDAQRNAPSAFGVFNIVYDGELLAHHLVVRDDLLALLRAHAA